jgi:hypothetical protein
MRYQYVNPFDINEVTISVWRQEQWHRVSIVSPRWRRKFTSNNVIVAITMPIIAIEFRK